MSEPKKPVEDEEFWRMRLVMAHITGRGLHTSVYDTDPETWNQIQNDTAGVLQRLLHPGMKLLDAGCAYGPLYSLVPCQVLYVGVDISHHFIEIAKLRHPEADFRVGDLALMNFANKEFDVTVLRSMQEMTLNNLGSKVWERSLKEIKRVSKRVLILEYEDIENYQLLETE